MRRDILHFGRVLPLAALVVGLLGLVRLGRQFPSAASSPALLVPFLLPVLALSLEAGALVALSVSTLRRLGRAPSRPLVGRALPALGLLGLLLGVLAVAQLLPRGTDRPGALANDLVQRARESCVTPGTTVAVPLLGLDVRCADPPVIEGPMPGVRSVRVAMRELSFSEDLRHAQMAGLALDAKRSLRVHLTAEQARVTGLPLWTRSARLSPLDRLGLLGGIGAGLSLAAVLFWVPRRAAPAEPGSSLRWGRRLGTLVCLSMPGGIAAALVIALDQEGAPAASYLGAALAGVAALGLLSLLLSRGPKLFSSFIQF
jgi:hypothetical protein